MLRQLASDWISVHALKPYWLSVISVGPQKSFAGISSFAEVQAHFDVCISLQVSSVF